MKASFWLVLLLPFCVFAQSPQTSPPGVAQADDQTPGIPRFYAQSRQVLTEVEVWRPADKKSMANPSWIPKTERVLIPYSERGYEPAPGLTSKDFRVFDNDIEQKINYFKPLGFPAFDWTGRWVFAPDISGTWGWTSSGNGIGFGEAIYLIGYVPPIVHPGECHSIRVVVEGHDHVYANRDRYCTGKAATEAATDASDSATLDQRMRSFADSRKLGFPLSMRAFAFWSSGVLSLAEESLAEGNTSAAASDYTYTVEVHDSRAPATVQIAAEFSEFGWPREWGNPCPKDAALRVLGRVYRRSGELLSEFSDTLPCRIPPSAPPWRRAAGALIPVRFDTQVELSAGDYDLRLVVSDGQLFAGAEVPLHIERLDPSRLMLSDVVIGGIVRYAGWVLREAAYNTPAPIIPSPLVSKDSQYFPDSEKVTRLKKHTPLYVYFEIYEPQNGEQGPGLFYRWRITNLTTGSVVMDIAPLSAANWVIPGNPVIPIGLKLDTEKLKKGSYKLEVQASDSAAQVSEWRAANFDIR